MINRVKIPTTSIPFNRINKLDKGGEKPLSEFETGHKTICTLFFFSLVCVSLSLFLCLYIVYLPFIISVFVYVSILQGKKEKDSLLKLANSFFLQIILCQFVYGRIIFDD